MAFDILSFIFGTQRERDLKALLPVLHAINGMEQWALTLSDPDFPVETERLRARIRSGERPDDLIPEAFALAREAARRVLGERPYDVQILGGLVMNRGKIVELKTGEGKTLSSVAAAYTNALAGKGVHIVTVNDYLAERDSAWMGRVYKFLGLSVGVILSNMDNEVRKAAYACDITYGTNNELGFDYLRDNMHLEASMRVQRGFNYCVVDEIDSILIDEARTPLIISGAAEDDTFKINEVNKMVGVLVEVEKNPETGDYPREEEGEATVGDYKIDEKSKRVSFTADGMTKIEENLKKRNLIKGSLYEEQSFEFIHYFTQAVRAQVLYHKDVEYVVQDGKVQIVDEFTGRILSGRRYSDGLHEAIEAKERIKVARRNRTMATITFQNFFRMYDKLAGMTGTADTEAAEFAKIYNLDVVVIPTNRPVVRNDEDDLVFLNEDDKNEAICDEIAEAHGKGQPVLVGTVSIEKSERLSSLLTRRGVRHEVLNAKNHEREAHIIAEAGAKGSVTIATNMAGRGTDIKLGGNPEFRAQRKAGTDSDREKYGAIYKEEYDRWRRDYEEVRSLGGLYVLGTERHESRRIDNQLRGRSGRQGDPGRSHFFISLDDDLMRLFGGANLKGVMGSVGMKPGEGIYHPWLNRSIESAQRKVEERNFEIRKHLLEYDDVLNQQRKFIYEQRDSILSDPRIWERVHAAAKEIAEDFLDEFQADVNRDRTSAWTALQDSLKSTLNVVLPYKSTDDEVLSTDRIREAMERALRTDVDEKLAIAGEFNLNQFLRFQYLNLIDQKWLDHLDNMEALREAVYLRSYAQKNPLTEYKSEGFDIFNEMIDSIRKSIASRLFLVRISRPEERGNAYSRQREANVTAVHQEVGQFGRGQQQGAIAAPSRSAVRQAESSASRPESVTVKRETPKVGRNDPCPCGSGKKYKHCHGQ